MLFNSWEFLVLLLATFLLYQLPVPVIRRKSWQVGLLLLASAVFYSWNHPKLLILLAVSCLLNALSVERILHWKSKETCQGNHQRARRWLWISVTLNLGFLAFFKYAGFLVRMIPESIVSEPVAGWVSDIPLPVGISFYTFQGISLLIDAWRNDISKQTVVRLSAQGRERIGSIRDTSFYVSFFPQLVAGPIVKAHEFVDQIGAKTTRDIDWTTVRRSLITGYFLKIFVADNLAEQTGVLTLGADRLVEMSSISGICLLYGYCFQIFADFAGYSLIAIGLGALFGYKLPPNFNFPYLSTSITEFWRRWHLSLSSWLRDYLYFPLGGNRKGAGRTYFNLFLVMFLGGLWHGAAWKFALWGSLHGLFLGVERLVMRRSKPASRPKRTGTTFAMIPLRIVQWAVTFHLVTFLWLTFMMPDMASIVAFFKCLSGIKLKVTGPPVFSLAFYGSAVVIYHAWGWLREYHQRIHSKISRSLLEPLVHGVMVFLLLSNPGAPQGFIYFQF